jgi:hypothetical protein
LFKLCRSATRPTAKASLPLTFLYHIRLLLDIVPLAMTPKVTY